MKHLQTFNQLLFENKQNSSEWNEKQDLMRQCLGQSELCQELDQEYEGYVRCKLQKLIDQKDYFQAKKELNNYYKDLPDQVSLLGKENISIDISYLNNNKDIDGAFSTKCSFSDEEAIEKLKKAIDCDLFIIKIGNDLDDYIRPDIISLLKEQKPQEALELLTSFFKPSIINGHSCFIEHDLMKAMIIRYINKHK